MEKDKNKIILDHYETVVGGTLAELANVPDTVGKVVEKETGNEVSECSALSVVLNESAIGWVKRFNALVTAGHDSKRVLNWHGQPKTVYQIMNLCPSRSRDFTEEGGLFQ